VHGSPLSAWALLVGRVAGSLVVALLTLISDVFVYGAAFPPLLDRIAWFFPLRHATSAMTTAAENNVVGSGLSWDHLGVMLAWALAGLAVVAWRFSWLNLEPSRRRLPAEAGVAPTARGGLTPNSG